MKNRYNLKNLKRAIRSPSLIINEVRRIWFRSKYGKCIDVMEQEWDNLIILDACRYDYFEECNHIDGNLTKVVSCGSHSWEFMQQTFLENEYHDTVYVTGNPYAVRIPPNTFHKVDLLLDDWDDEIGTIRPESVVEASLRANENYPNKRLIIHFMQPHRPYLGPTGETYRTRDDIVGWDRNAGKESREDAGGGIDEGEAVERGTISVSELRRSYRECLEIVLEHVEQLLSELNGKSVVTADHGEFLGERRLKMFGKRQYTHDARVYRGPVRLVPWLTVDDGTRRNVVADEPQPSTNPDDSIIDNRLQALGYK